MKTRSLMILAFTALMIPISNTFATEPQMIPLFQPDMELIPDDEITYGESFTIHAWLESYDDLPDELGFHVDVLDPYHDQVDSTLWFAKQDFVYEFDTTHPAYNITKSGTYQIKIEKTDLMQRAGIILKTLPFEILFSEHEQDESISENCGAGNVFEDGTCVPNPNFTGSSEIVDGDGEKICLGGRGMILNDQCQRIGNYDLQTGIPIVNNKEECDRLDGTWYDDRKLCDSKYAPVEYRFQFGPEPMPNEKFPLGAIVDCIGGLYFNGTACVPDDSLEISYGHQWLLKIIFIVIVLAVIVVGIIIGVKVWRKRK